MPKDDPAAVTRSDSRARDAAPVERRRVGVLFVHGAGDHTTGATLREFGEPLIAWLDGWLSSGEPPSEGLATDRVKPGAAQVLVREADSASPAHLELDVRSRADAEPHRWVFAESRWDAAFAPPEFKSVLLWALTVVPWTVATQFVYPLHDKWAALRPSIGSTLRFVVEAILAFILVVVGAVVLQVFALAILVLSLIPLDTVRLIASRLQRFASTSVGDLYVVLVSPTERAALAGAVQRDVRWLRAQGCERIAVVAHSQGGFVAHQALTDPWHPPVDLFVTLGSGLIRLTESERARRANDLIPSLIGLLGVLLFVRYGVEAVFGAFDYSRQRPTATLVAELGFFMMLVAVPPLRRYLDGRRRAYIAPLPGATRWVDYLTLEDPVLNGHREGRLPDQAERVRVVNRASVIADHGSYWDNTDQFVAKVALELADLDPALAVRASGPALGPADVSAHLDRSWTARELRVSILERVRLVFTAAVATLIIGQWSGLASVGFPVAQWLGRLPKVVRDVGGSIADTIVPFAGAHLTILGAAVIAVLAAIGYRLSVSAWDAWGDADTRRQWAGLAPSPLAAGAVAFHAWVATMFALVALVAWYGPGSAVASIGWMWAQRDDITRASVLLVLGSAAVLVPVALVVWFRDRRLVDDRLAAKAATIVALTVVFDVAFAAASPGRHVQNLVIGAVIAALTAAIVLWAADPLAWVAYRTGSRLHAWADRASPGPGAQPGDLLWLPGLVAVVLAVPLAVRATPLASLIAVLFAVSAIGFGLVTEERGQERPLKALGAASVMAGLTMVAIAVARAVQLQTGIH